MNRREFVRTTVGIGALSTINSILPTSLAHNDIKVGVADLVKIEIPDSVHIVFYIEGRHNDKNQKGLCMKQHNTETDIQIYNYDSANIKLIYKNGAEEYPILGTQLIVYPRILRPTDHDVQNRLGNHNWYFNRLPDYDGSSLYLNRIHLEWSRWDLNIREEQCCGIVVSLGLPKGTYYMDLHIGLQTSAKYKIDSNDGQCRRFGMDFCSNEK